MKKQHNNKNRTESVLSVIITTALILTLALTVATAINKGNSEKNNNIVDLNETEGYNAQLNNEENTTQAGKEDNASNSSNSLTDNTTTKIGSANNDADNKLADNSLPDSDKKNDNTTDNTDINASHTTSEDLTAVKNSENDSTIEDNIAVDAADSVTSNLSFSENGTLYWPVAGDIILKYNMDNTIWFPTLGVYKCNPAIYISSEAGTEISASCTGVVESISKNEETGTNVIVSIGNGYTLTYGAVDNVQVIEGDLVKAGDTIGYVAEPSMYYTQEGPGLMFQVDCNGTPCDPMNFLE